MSITKYVADRVHSYYWDYDINCATATLRILAQHFNVALDAQILDASIGMHGAGGHRAQCGLVEGGLLFLGIYGRIRKLGNTQIVELCKTYAEEFETCFSSLQCRKLRPEGFNPDLPPHLCEKLTCRTNEFTIHFITTHIG